MAEKSALQRDAIDRLGDAKTARSYHDDDFREGYFFTAPHRIRPGNKSTAAPPADAKELQTSVGYTVALDFATVILNSFVPQTEDWLSLGAGPEADPGQEQQILAKLLPITKAVFTAIRASNFYEEFGKCAFPDVSLGTIAMLIEDKGLTRPLTCLGQPIRKLYLALGPDGRPDDRFIEDDVKYRNLPALLPGVALPEDVAKKVRERGNGKCTLVWGWWRDWTETADEVWQHVVMINQKLVHQARLVGAGSCPLVVGRFNPTTDSPWGYGPLIMALSDLRGMDELEALKLEGIDFQTRPPVAIPDTSAEQFENGIEPGMAYPTRVGDEAAIKPIYQQGGLDAVLYETQRGEARARKIHFVDYPEQRGDTPPTAYQWQSELQMAQRRIGTPGLAFWSEFCLGVFLRYKYLLEKRGTIKEAVVVNGQTVAATPENPAKRAADMQEVQNALQLIEIGSKAFPEEWKLVVDGKATVEAFKAKFRDLIVRFRSADQINTALNQITQLQGGQAAGAPPAGPGVM